MQLKAPLLKSSSTIFLSAWIMRTHAQAPAYTHVQAGEQFRDAAVVSLIQWGNVFIVKADRQLQALAKAGSPVKGKDLASIMALYDETQKK